MDSKNMKKKGQVDPNSTEFERQLREYLEETPSSPKINTQATTKINMDEELKKGLTVDEYNDLINKKNEMDRLDRARALKAYEEQQSLNMKKLLDKNKASNLLNPSTSFDFDPTGTKSMHATTNQVSQDALDYVKKQQNKSKLFNKLSSIFKNPLTKKLGAVAKYAGPAAAALGVASDVLASEDVGSQELEDKELNQAKREEMIKRLPVDKKLLMQDMQKKGQEDSYKQKASDLISIASPTIKQLGGESDINPKKAKSLTGEKSSPDIEQITQGLSRDEYEKMMKKKLGY